MSKVRDIKLFIIFKFLPAQGEKTETKDWKKTGKWAVIEQPIITDSIKDRMVHSADFIINITTRQVEKNRSEKPNDEILLKYIEKYSKEIAQFCARFRPELLDELIEDKNLDAPEKEPETPVQEAVAEVISVDETVQATNA